jgi:hypothetical protein
MEATAMTMMMHDVEDAMWDDAEAEDTWMRRQEEEASKMLLALLERHHAYGTGEMAPEQLFQPLRAIELAVRIIECEAKRQAGGRHKKLKIVALKAVGGELHAAAPVNSRAAARIAR